MLGAVALNWESCKQIFAKILHCW